MRYNDDTIKVSSGYNIYTRVSIDKRWPLYLKVVAQEMLNDYGFIMMDDSTGYPIDVDYYTRDQIFNQIY